MTEIVHVRVLNGEARIGDKVAFAARVGNTAEIRMGEVVGFEKRRNNWYSDGETDITRVKIRVSLQSDHVNFGSGYGDKPEVDRVVGIERTERIILL